MSKYESLKQSIIEAYESCPDLNEAEKLATRFLEAMMNVAEDLRTADLDARMKKSGVKAIRAAVYMKHATASDRKPSDVMLDAIVNQDKLVMEEQARLDEAEVEVGLLENYMQVFTNAHVHFRGVSKARFT